MALPDAAKNKFRAPLRPFDVPTASLSVLGLGFLRPAPGTWGSLPTPIVIAVLLLAGAPWWAISATAVAFLVVSSTVCVMFGRYAEERFGRKDASEVVCDETAGVSLSLLFVPQAIAERCALASNDIIPALFFTGLVTGAAFFLFRVSDIIKPQPARKIEKLAHGWGVLLDDIIAGIYSSIAWWALILLVM